eukprot:54904-Eustigmatos_ZCMA.PRE.1
MGAFDIPVHRPLLLHITAFLPGKRWKDWSIDEASKNGWLSFLRTMPVEDERWASITTKAIDAAARNGYLGVVQWLHSMAHLARHAQ